MLRVLLLLVASTAVAHAGQATCSNPGLPLGAAAARDLFPGRLTLNLTTGVLPIHSEETLLESQGPVVYDTELVLLETRLAGEYALAPWLAITLAVPYRMVDIDVTHRNPATGQPIAPPTSIHSRTETIRGIGDPLVTARLARELGPYRLFVRAGATLPLGRTEEDPHALGRIGLEHQHVQLGTGTVVPFASVELQRRVGRHMLAAFALAYVSVLENDKGFRASDRFGGGISASSQLGLRRWTFNAGLEGYAETAETWQGVVYEDEGNAGRFDLFAGGGAAFRVSNEFAVFADAKLPVYSHVVGPQLDYGLVASFGVAGTFDLRSRPSYRGVDEQAVAAPGVAAELVPVPGKITVFDLWAAWCPPCRELDARLAAIARAHPDRIAIRKLDVVDADSPAWKRHLAPGTFDLPHVKVYGADGELMFERTAPPAELAAAIEQLLAN